MNSKTPSVLKSASRMVLKIKLDNTVTLEDTGYEKKDLRHRPHAPCPFCGMGPFNYTDIFNPTMPAPKPVVEPEKPIPIVIPTPVPSAKGDIASLIESLSKQKQTPFPTSSLKNLFF
jgi:hypothetical protein